jgi:hypothetical protein
VRLSTLLLLCGFAVGASSSAFAGSPTDDAFDALLSIPQAAAEDGEWNHSAPEGFDIDGGEDALIEWLTASKEEGADFAELRHQGSLLHHAIRAGLDRTALWLLAHGANPLQTLDNASEGADALAIAIEHRRWPVIEVLLKRADVTAAARRTKLASTWLSLPVAATDADIARLSALKLPLPEGKLANALLYNALIRRWYGLALTLAEHGATPPDGLRPRAELNTQPLQTETIERLDARLTVPLFAYLAAQPTDRKEVDTIWALRVRKPFEDAAFTRGVVIAVLDSSRTAEMRTATLQRIPAAALTAALSDGEVFKRWIKWAITLPTADSEWAFAATGDWPRERPVEFVEALRSSASWYHATPKNPALDDAWRRTLARLPKPIPAALNGQLWMFVPFDQRGDLLALGYVPGNQELAYWLDRDSVDNLRTIWPAMKATVPDIGPRIHAALIGDCVLGQRDGTMRLDERVLEKSRVLSEGGARPAQPLILDSACRGNADKAALAGLEQDGIVATAPPLRNDRFRIPAKTCRFEPDARWRDALLSNHQVGSFEAVGAQLVPLPGSDECGVLVWGGNFGGRVEFNEDDFSGSRRFSPCTEGESATALWRIVDGRVRQTVLEGLSAIAGAVAVQDTDDDTPLLLAGGIDLGGCGSTPTVLLGWNASDAAQPLHALPHEDARAQAYYAHCSAAGETPVPECTAADGWSLSIEDFIDRYWSSERDRYVAAVLALDYPALSTLRQQPLPPQWTRRAIAAVSDAKLPLADKRERTAWLFRDPQLTSVLDYDATQRLLPWLPAEDWTPVLNALKNNTELLHVLFERAERDGHTAQACRIARALGRGCSKG